METNGYNISRSIRANTIESVTIETFHRAPKPIGPAKQLAPQT